MPAAVIWPVKKRPNSFAVSMTALYPAILAWEGGRQGGGKGGRGRDRLGGRNGGRVRGRRWSEGRMGVREGLREERGREGLMEDRGKRKEGRWEGMEVGTG